MCVGGYFQGEGQEKLLCKGGGSQHEKLKNKNIGGGVFCQLNLISKKAPMQKMQKNAKKKKKKKNQTLKNFSSLVLLTRHFTKFIFWSS